MEINSSNQQPSINQQNNYIPRKSVGEWFLSLFLLSIPLVNIIMLIMWATGDSNDERKNFAKAHLLWFLVVFVLVFLLLACFRGFALISDN